MHPIDHVLPRKLLYFTTVSVSLPAQVLPPHIIENTQDLVAVASTLLTIALVLPSFFPVALSALVAYFLLGWLFAATARKLKRFESLANSPLIGLFGETLHGVVTVRVSSRLLLI